VIDMGPEGGAAGGTVIAEGSPEQVAAIDTSYTGQFLRAVVDVQHPTPPRRRRVTATAG
jgi:excinuclease ABC subunit A